MKALEILSVAANAANGKKGKDLSAVEVGDLTILSEYILIVSATSATHVRALADEIEAKLSEAGVEPHHIEGRATGWILLDYDEVIIHVFSKDAREFYELDRIWRDGTPVNLDNILKQSQED